MIRKRVNEIEAAIYDAVILKDEKTGERYGCGFILDRLSPLTLTDDEKTRLKDFGVRVMKRRPRWAPEQVEIVLVIKKKDRHPRGSYRQALISALNRA